MSSREATDAPKPRGGPRSEGARRKQPPSDSSKRDRILDTAERLFADGGFDGVSMRDIASAAEVGLPLIVYHFETKRNLYRALFERHRSVLESRLEALRRPVEPGEDPIEHIVRAFVEPVTRIQNTEAGMAYAKLVAREASDPRDDEHGIASDYFDPFAEEFIQAILEVLPGHDESYAAWAYMFAVGALVLSAFDERIERISLGRVKSADLERKTEYLVRFIVAGIRAGARPE